MTLDSFTRQEVLNLKAEQARVEYDPHILNTFYVFLKDCGMTYDLDKMTKENRRKFVLHAFESLFIFNSRCPAQINMNGIMAKFMSHVVYDTEALKEKSTRGLVTCFNEWINRKEVLASLGVQLSKALPPPDASRPAPVGRLEDWPDDLIQQQASMIEALNYRAALPDQSKGYSFRILTELAKRNLNTYPIELW